MVRRIFTVSQELEMSESEDKSTKIGLNRLLSKKLRDWSLQSTSHGVPRLVDSKHILVKIMWALFLSVSIGLCTFIISQTISHYFDYDVTTKIREITPDVIEFPAVSICNLNPFVTEVANDFVAEFKANPMEFNMSKYFINATDDELESMRPMNKSAATIDWLKYITAHPKFDDTLRRKFSDWPDMFFKCAYHQLPLNPQFDFDHFYHAVYGNCFRLNGKVKYLNGKTRPFLNSGKEGEGLYMDLFIGPSDLFYPYEHQPRQVGIKIFLTQPDVIPYPEPGLFIKPGTGATIKVSRVDTNTLPKPYSNCIEADLIDNELVSEMRRLGLNYTRRDCLELCTQKLLHDRHKCYSLRLPKIFLDNYPPCPFQTQQTFFNTSECVKLCPHECSSRKYDVSVSYADFPSRTVMDILMREIDYFKWAFQLKKTANSSASFDSLELARTSLVSLSIYYDDIRYTSITESPSITFVDLIASIGGTLGLFIGISLLSFVEVIELLLEIVLIIWFNYKKK